MPRLSAPPLLEPMTGPDGKVTRVWALWFKGLYDQAGGAAAVAPVSVTGNAATATQAETAVSAETVPPVTASGLPTVTNPDAATGTMYTDTDTGFTYYKSPTSGWARLSTL